MDDRFCEPQLDSYGDTQRNLEIQWPEKLVVLILLLALELWIFSGAFHKFFTHDSLFYMTHIAHSWDEFVPFLLGPSQEMSYRPTNLAVVALLSPLLGVEPHPWHWIPILFHLANTLLFYRIARKILAGSSAALAAASFWGLHAVAGWITYDITYLSDFLLAFLLLLSILLAIEAHLRTSRFLGAAALAAFVLSLMTKEAATTFPLAIWISIVLADLRKSGHTDRGQVWQAIKRSAPFLYLFMIVDLLFVGLYGYWLAAGHIYAQGTQSAYDISLFSNLLGKTKYFFWALNLPDVLNIQNAQRNRLLALGLMGVLLLIWARDLLRRRLKLSTIEWAGILWFVGLNMPAFLLSHRLAKWYLYIPLFGLSLAFGVFAENLRTFAGTQYRRVAGLCIPLLLIVPIVASSRVQTRSYIAASDSVYQSDLLESCLSDFRQVHPSLPPQATLFFLPAFEEGVSDLLSADPIGHGELFGLFYPGTQIKALFAHKGDKIPADIGTRSDVIVLQYLDQRLYDVTAHFKSNGKMTLYLLPTLKAEIAPLLKKEPAGGSRLYGQFVTMLIADAGKPIPEDYLSRSDLWILQYIEGHFTDITRYYMGRHADDSQRVVRGLDGVKSSMNQAEFYPSYDRFDTPTGAPAFFPTPEKDILTQIGGSTITIPLQKITGDSRLRFDVSWMYDQGDGGWAEAAIRAKGKETSVFREYLKPDSKRRNLVWQEVRVDLQDYQNVEAELILKCYNDPGKNTIADWLNWRDIVIERKR
jgi:hypothetical protein